jgi:hypothetical protein
MVRLTTAAAALTAAFAFATAVGAATSAVFLHVTPATVHRGHPVLIRGNAGNAGDCAPGETVFVLSRAFAHTHEFAGVSAVLAKVRTGGAFSARPRIPSHRHVGTYVVTARCGGGNLGVSAHLTVVA